MSKKPIKLFISGEINATISNNYRVARNAIEKKIQSELLNKNNYGDAVKGLGIVPIIIPNQTFIDFPKYKERKLFSHKQKEADIRLKINYEDFKNSNDKGREKLIVQNVIESIRIVKSKVKGKFHAEKLINDISKLFKLN